MRRIILHMMLSLDGLIAGPNDDLSWHIVDEDWNRRAIEGGVLPAGLAAGPTRPTLYPVAASADAARVVSTQA